MRVAADLGAVVVVVGVRGRLEGRGLAFDGGLPGSGGLGATAGCGATAAPASGDMTCCTGGRSSGAKL